MNFLFIIIKNFVLSYQKIISYINYSLPIERINSIVLFKKENYYLPIIIKFNMNLSKALFLVALITLNVLLVLGMISYLRV